MARAQATGRIGSLGLMKALYLKGPNNVAGEQISFGNQSFLNDKTTYTFIQRLIATSNSMSDVSNWWAYGFDSATNKGYCGRAAGSGSRKFQWFYGNASSTATNLTVNGKPQVIIVEFDGTTLRFYDGTTLKDSFTVNAARNGHATIGTYLGCRDPGNRQFIGILGDGAIYDRVLTADEKKQITYFANYPKNGAQIIVTNNQSSGTTIPDYSGNGRNGTLGTGLWRNSPFNA